MGEYKYACILNPVAGNGYAHEHIAEIRSKLEQFASHVPIIETEYPGHATEIANKLVHEGYDTILVAGGDGTVHEVGSALIGKQDIVLGIISAGTGNDYNYLAGFPDRFSDKHWEHLFSRHYKAYDVGVCNGEYFFNGMGLGFDATMTANSHEDREKTGKSGKGRYTWIILKTLFGYKELKREATIDNVRSTRQSFLTTIAIGKRFAGSYHLTPKAVPDDGLLDLCDVAKIGIISRLRILLKVPKGSHLDEPVVSYEQCKVCYFQFAQKVPAHLDGELIYAKDFNISIMPKAINIITFA